MNEDPNTADYYLKAKIKSDRQSLFWLLAGTLFLLLFFLPTGKEKLKDTAYINSSEKTLSDNFYKNLNLSAKSAYVFDVNEKKVLFAYNENVQLPLASLTKIMTAVTALELMPRGTIISVEHDSLRQEGDSGLSTNERFTLSDLLGLTLTESSNDGAYAIASVAGSTLEPMTNNAQDRVENFVAQMNAQARKLGLTQTYFLNPTGLDEGLVATGGYGSAQDLATLMAYAIKTYPDVFNATNQNQLKIESLNSTEHDAKNTNTAVDRIPNLIASKTGYTDQAGGNLVIAFNSDFSRPIVVAVLGSTIEDRFEDTVKLVWATLDSLSVAN